MPDQDRTPKKRKRSAVGSPPIPKNVLRSAVGPLASFPTSELINAAARIGDMAGPISIKNIVGEEALRVQNSAVSDLAALSSLAILPTSELIGSAARIGDVAGQIGIKNIVAEEALRVQNSAASSVAEMLAEQARVANSAVSGLAALSSLASLPTSELIGSAARIGDMAGQIGIKNIAAVMERTTGIAASIIETMPTLPSLTPANFDFVLDGSAERAWKGFSDRAAALASDDALVGQESVQPLLEDAASVAAHAPAESKGKVESLIRLVLISVFANIIADSAVKAGKALWPLLIALLTSVPVPEPLPPPPPPALIEEASPSSPELLVPGGWRIEGLPGLIRKAGSSAEQRLVEFFTAEIRNPNTRQAYACATARFFEWCENRNLALAGVTPFAVAAYIEEMQDCYAQPTVKQHLAAIRTMFDYLVVGQVLPVNPAASVRGPKHVVKKGKTPVLTASEARALLDSIDIGTCSGVRDRALLGTMVYSFARVGAVVGMNVEDYYRQGKRWWLRLHEKGGKFHEVPAHHNAEEYLDAYLDAAGIGNRKGAPLWRSMSRERTFSENRMGRIDVFRMIKRRVHQAELGAAANCHTFRATGITAYLLNGGSIENAQAIAAHESPRTTKLYDKTADEITLDEIERIVI